MTDRQILMITGFAGLLAAVLVGAGEFLLHFDPLGRYAQDLDFLVGIDESRATVGHFLGVLAAPLYIAGAWHIRMMLRPANELFALIAFGLMSYGLIIGAVWIGSRATAVTIVNLDAGAETIRNLRILYDIRYQTLLSVTRIAILSLSGIFIWLCLTGRSRYPRWMALLNPIFLILISFAVFAITPQIGKYIIPIALNVAFFILFFASLCIAARQSNTGAN